MREPETGRLYSSSDFGQTWVRHDCFPPAAHFVQSGDVRGAGDAIYVQGYDDETHQSGLWRTTDGGLTSKFVGGPMNYPDTRFFVPSSCNGGIVVAADTSGTVWVTTDGGDGTLVSVHDPIVASTLGTSKEHTITACQTDSAWVSLSNIQCRAFVVTSASITGDSSRFFTLDTLGRLPLRFENGGSMTVHLEFDPHNTPGTYQTLVHLRYYDETMFGPKYYDTVLPFTVIVKPIAPEATLSATAIDLGATSICESADTSITVTNVGCDKFVIDRSSLTGSSDFTLTDSLELPYTLPQDSSITLHIHYHPSGKQSASAQLHFHTLQQGVGRDTTISFTALGIPGTGSLVSSAPSSTFQFSDRSICGTGDSAEFAFHNPGCDTVTVTGYDLTTDPNFTFTASSQSGSLIGGDSIVYRWYVSPQAKGSHTVQLTVHYTLPDGSKHDTTYSASVNILSGTKTLAASLDTVDFGALYVCEGKDSIFTLRNTGCDTLTLDAPLVSSGDFSLSGNATYPLVLLPGSSIPVTLHASVDTAGHVQQVSGVVTLTSTADNSVRPVVLTSKVLYPTHLRIEVVNSDTAKNGSLVTFRIMLDGSIPPATSALHFDLTHNDDLLSYTTETGPGLSIDRTDGPSTSQVQHFTLSPVNTTGEIGELTYKVFLASAATSPLTLSNIRFDTKSTLPTDCIASIDDSNASFTYLYDCGEHLIQQYMQTNAFTIDGITPNPAESELHISLARLHGSAELSLIDILGNPVLSQTIESSTTLDVTHIPSGTYFLRITAAGQVQSRTVVIER